MHCVVGLEVKVKVVKSSQVSLRDSVRHQFRPLGSSAVNTAVIELLNSHVLVASYHRKHLKAPFKMRPSLLRLASAANTQRGLKPNPMALLPPIPLYRRLLRAHRKHLPAEMRLLGDEYIKAEFRAHRKVDNPAHLVCQFKGNYH